uniref:Arf-GAP domain-containing protein n=1 Tax=Periophthalmus magnuspinnatus TaxID=409849 RepID=A0A3B4B3I6_9GOBI
YMAVLTGNCNIKPEWASLPVGVLVCQACSLLHRSIPHITRVKSVQDTWEPSEVEVKAQTLIKHGRHQEDRK